MIKIRNFTINYLLTGFLIFLSINHCKISDCQVAALPVDVTIFPDTSKIQHLIGPSVLQKKNDFIWGASVIKGDDNRYHMFYSTWNCGRDSLPFSSSWVLNSTIGYAISDDPDRNFEFQKIILEGAKNQGDSTSWDAQSVHNPHIQKFGKYYYLYYTGSMDPGAVPESETLGYVNKRNRVQQSQKIGVHFKMSRKLKYMC